MSVPLLFPCATRFQSQLPGQKRYTRVFPTLATIYTEEGPSALYKGFVPKALRLGIGQTVGLMMFQQLLKLFGGHDSEAAHAMGEYLMQEAAD
jgi:solute carrier family 25 2-oxodicarboxylate transporter 21